MIIYRTTDELPIKIGSVTFYISPLTAEQRQKMYDSQTQKSGEIKVNAYSLARVCLRYALKRVDGIETPDGEKYVLKKHNGGLTDETLDELETIPIYNKLRIVASNWAAGLPFDDVPGVEVKQVVGIKKKRTQKK